MFSLRCPLVLKIMIFNLRDLFSVPNFSSIQLRVDHHSRIVFSLLINFWLGSTKIQHQPIFFLLWIYCKVDILYWFSKIVSLWSLLYWWNKEKLFFSGITFLLLLDAYIYQTWFHITEKLLKFFRSFYTINLVS